MRCSMLSIAIMLLFVMTAAAGYSGIRTIDSTGQDCFKICKAWPGNPYEIATNPCFWIDFTLPAAHGALLAFYEVEVTIMTPRNDTVYAFESNILYYGTHNVTWDCEDSFIELPKGMHPYIFEIKAYKLNVDKQRTVWNYEVRLPFYLRLIV